MKVLLTSLAALTINVQKGQLLGYGKILKASDVLSLHPFVGLNIFSLPYEDPFITALFSNADFSHLLLSRKTRL